MAAAVLALSLALPASAPAGAGLNAPAGTSATGATGVSPGCPSSYATAFGDPAWVIGCHLGGQGFTSPVVGTIDGVKAVVLASLSGMVYVVNAATGRELPGWPQRSTLVGNTATAIDSSPSIAYLDGSGHEPSIVVGLGSQYVKDQNGGVMAWYANGHVRFRFLTKRTFAEWHGQPNDWSDAVFGTPAIGDVTGDGQQDIVFGSFDHYVYALTPSGKVVPGFPILRADTIWSSPALADTTHTGKMDIIEGGDASGWRGPFGGPECYSGWVSDYRYEFGAPRLVWERCLAETVWSSPAVTTFGTTPVVVTGTSWFHGPGRNTEPAENEVFAFNALNGKTMPGWPVNAGGPSFGSPAVAPLVAGGSNDVIESACADCLNGPSVVSAWSQQGHLLWRDDITQHSELLASPAVASVNGSTTNDVLIGNVAGLFVLNGATGAKVDDTATYPINGSCNVGGTPVVAEVPGTRTGWMMFTNCGFNGPTRTAANFLRAYDIPAPQASEPWPMFRANAQRTGVPDPNGQTDAHCTTPKRTSGYRLVGAAGGVWGFGASGYCGGLTAEILPQNVAGIASVPNGGGYWLALKDGAVYAFGDARNYGDLRHGTYSSGKGDIAPGAPIVGISPTPNGKGYYLLAGDGSVYGFGDAKYHGSVGGYHAGGTPDAIATDLATGGYWITTTAGHVYNFDAPFFGSQPSGHFSPIVGIAAMHSGKGYWLVTQSGYVYNFGGARRHGSEPGKTIVGITAGRNDRGYYLASNAGNIYQKGHVPFAGSAPGRTGGQPVIAISAP